MNQQSSKPADQANQKLSTEKAQDAKKHSQVDESGADLGKREQTGRHGKTPADQRTNER